jgi:hypothetical protein
MMDVRMMPDTERYFSQGMGVLALWLGLLAAPLAWLVNLLLSYSLVLWACSTGRQYTLHLVTLAMLLLAAVGGVIAWRAWRQAGREWHNEAGGVLPRSRFMAALGVLLSSLFSLVILAQGIPSFILPACEP